MKIGAYKNLEIGKSEFTPATEAEVMVAVEELLASRVVTEAKEGKSQMGDIVNIDFEGFLNGTPFDGGKDEGYDLELGSGSFIPGFEEQLVGYEKGAEVSVNVTFPEAYHAEELAGKAVVFKCKINDIKVKVEPELNDKFAQELGMPSAEVLKTALANQLNQKKQMDSENEYLEKVIKAIIASSEIEVSEDLVKAKIDETVGYYEQNMAQYGMSLEAYLGMTGKTLEEFRDSVTEESIDAAKEEIIFDEIAKKERITVTTEMMDRELTMYKEYYKLDQATFEEFANKEKDAIEKSILRRQVAELLFKENK